MSSPTWQDFLSEVFAGSTSLKDVKVDKVFEKLSAKRELRLDKLDPKSKQALIEYMWKLAHDKPEERRQLYIDLSRILDKFFEWQDVENPPAWTTPPLR